MYTNDEKTDMILIFGECRRNASEAARLYSQRYPNRRSPTDKIFRRLEMQLRQNWPALKRLNKRTATCEENEINVIEAITQDPHISQRTISGQVGISQASVSRIIRANQFHPYHVHLVQNLEENDFLKRLQFIHFMRHEINGNDNFLNCVLFSDEARFSNNGSVNKHNCHYYAQVNPRWMVAAHFQRVYTVNVWCGILGDHVIGPHFFEGNLTGEIYLDFLVNILPTILDDVDLLTRQQMFYQHDGAPPHYHINVRNYLNRAYENKWIGRGAVVPWPPRSPDITPLDFFLWGYVKELVYQTPIENEQHLRNRIEEACRSITPQMLARVRRSFLRRLEECETNNGGHFEHLLG